MTDLITIKLDRRFFSQKKKLIAKYGSLKAYGYTYDSGVEGLKIENKLGYIETLPYKGQQIWRCNLLGRELAMDSTFDEPAKTHDYLGTYGAFLLHCGATAMGVPSKSDSHPLHGELPNACYEKAYLIIGQDEDGKFIALKGQYNHRIAFNSNYIASPTIKVYEDSSIIDVSMTIKNLKAVDVDLMYMMHINFKPIDNSELIYSANYDPNNIMVHANVPSHMKADAGLEKLINYLEELKTKPELHHKLDPKLPYNPEVVFIIKYKEDEDGNAHSMQLHPDGYASYVSHRPSQLKYGVRWISRTNDEDALGLVLPATAGHRGYNREKELGNIEVLPGRQAIEYNVRLGILNPEESAEMKNRIASIK